ncbi:MAG TPA: DeoR/GlpR family DNA-binding transcription regulator [Candidatus Blautia faecavium]|uniref:DeoR/GlpR family DNA-binding transcription regulator n=1 Tax=Candidatus Blautia faecavium TaxID=2838487 RepID=A0A9D2LQF2_9FIRM|nr:DeoR/GlpR family DNA-binding transcription regulator [Candidatus Blautia faecavium]
MLYNERAELILQQLQLQSTVKVTELSQLLQVSVDTIRRDLKAMEQEGLIKCVRGGACLPESVISFSNFTGREIINSEWKREIARKASGYIREGDVVALNSGTTNTVLAQELAALNKNFTVVTNNYAAIDLLMHNPSIRLISIGGEVDALERSTFGTVCEQEFKEYYPDVVFLSINAVDYKEGFTDFRFGEIGVIQLLAQTSKKVIAVMDSSKLGKCSKRKVLSLDQVDVLLMDDHVPAEIKEKYRKKGLEIL